MSHKLLAVDNVWKKYSKTLKSSIKYGAVDFLPLRRGPDSPDLRPEEFWALQNITFDLDRGESLGIIGLNGSGKSTLLKCIANTIMPDGGQIAVRGTMGHIIELSAGFIPTMTGRENVALRGKLLGKRGTDLQEYVDGVRDFSEIDEFFDSPVQFYSSGMKSRLGFAASSEIHPDILLIDEVLSVGDLSFRLKCYERIDYLAKSSALVFVSHSLGQVARLCTKLMYLKRGRVRHYGDVQSGIRLYQQDCNSDTAKDDRHSFNPELISFTPFQNGLPVSKEQELPYGSCLTLDIDVTKVPPDSWIRVLLKDTSQTLICDWNSARSGLHWNSSQRLIRCHLGRLELTPGRYLLSLQIMGENGKRHISLSNQFSFIVTGSFYYPLPVQRTAEWTVPNEN